jgi:hypothetical protein
MSQAKSKPHVKIENWSVVDSVIATGYQELAPGQRLTGSIVGHADLPNGIIYTSAIVSVDRDTGVVETLNTLYQLGQIDAEYDHWLTWQRAEHAA